MIIGSRKSQSAWHCLKSRMIALLAVSGWGTLSPVAGVLLFLGSGEWLFYAVWLWLALHYAALSVVSYLLASSNRLRCGRWTCFACTVAVVVGLSFVVQASDNSKATAVMGVVFLVAIPSLLSFLAGSVGERVRRANKKEGEECTAAGVEVSLSTSCCHQNSAISVSISSVLACTGALMAIQVIYFYLLSPHVAGMLESSLTVFPKSGFQLVCGGIVMADALLLFGFSWVTAALVGPILARWATIVAYHISFIGVWSLGWRNVLGGIEPIFYIASYVGCCLAVLYGVEIGGRTYKQREAERMKREAIAAESEYLAACAKDPTLPKPPDEDVKPEDAP